MGSKPRDELSNILDDLGLNAGGAPPGLSGPGFGMDQANADMDDLFSHLAMNANASTAPSMKGPDSFGQQAAVSGMPAMAGMSGGGYDVS